MFQILSHRQVLLIIYACRVLIELLNMQVDPSAIYKLLKQIRKTKRINTATGAEGGNVL